MEASIGTYALFVIFFTIITDRSRYARYPYYSCYNNCNPSDDYWYLRHRDDSYSEFWSAALICFIIGAYQIAGSMITFAQLPLPKQISLKPFEEEKKDN